MLRAPISPRYRIYSLRKRRAYRIFSLFFNNIIAIIFFSREKGERERKNLIVGRKKGGKITDR